MKSAVIVFPGSNCDRDMAVALEQVSGSKPAMVWHRETELPDGIDLVAIPGGFSYGDYLRSGAMAARSPVMRAVKAAAERGVSVRGVCNGFQILTEAPARRSPFRSAIMTAITRRTKRRSTGSRAMAVSPSAMRMRATGLRATSPASSAIPAMCWA